MNYKEDKPWKYNPEDIRYSFDRDAYDEMIKDKMRLKPFHYKVCFANTIEELEDEPHTVDEDTREDAINYVHDLIRYFNEDFKYVRVFLINSKYKEGKLVFYYNEYAGIVVDNLGYEIEYEEI